MKKILLLVAVCIPLMLSAQFVTDKNIKSAGYGEKKMSKAPKKVFINKFFVNYQVVSSSSETATDKDFNKSRAEMAVGLTGIDVSDFQEITDAAYNRAVDKMQKAGFEVLAIDDLPNSEMLSSYTLLKGGQPSRAQLMGYISTAPNGYDFYVKKVTKKGKGKSAFFDVTPKLSKELGNIPVFEFTSNLQFVKIEGSSFAGAAKMKGKVAYVMPYNAIAQSSEGIFGSKIETSTTSARFVYKGRAAGAAAESIVWVYPKGDIEIPGVVEEKKFKEFVNSNPYNPAFGALVFSEEKRVEVSHQVQADKKAYKEKTLLALNEYLDVVIDEFIANANK